MKGSDLLGLLVIGLAAVAIGQALSADPRCGRGCQTVAEHLITHGLWNVFRALGV